MLDSSQEGEKVVKPDTQCSSHHKNPRYTEEEEGKEEYCRDLTKSRKVQYKTGWEHSQDAVYWIHLGWPQEKGMAFWQTKPHAIIANSIVPPDSIEQVISQRREMSMYQRSLTQRPAPRIVLKRCLA